jgi:hypothetical protein
MPLSSNPRISKVLMQITWVIGGIGFWNAFNSLGSGDVESATQWISAWAVGGVGLLSFVRHAVFHRSDALRMGWDYGARNDFQIEVGFANLAWGVVAIVGILQGWGTQALGALVLLVGIYMIQAAALHLLELKEAKQPNRYGSKLANTAYALCMLWFGISALAS